MYQSAGYFLTRVAIPPQALDDGGAVSVKGEVDVSRIQRREERGLPAFLCLDLALSPGHFER